MRMKELIKALAERLDKEADLTLEAHENVEKALADARTRIEELEYGHEAALKGKISALEGELEAVMDEIDRVLKGGLVKSSLGKGVSGYVKAFVDEHQETSSNFTEWMSAYEGEVKGFEETIEDLRTKFSREKALRQAAETHSFTRAQEMVAGMYKVEEREDTK